MEYYNMEYYLYCWYQFICFEQLERYLGIRVTITGKYRHRSKKKKQHQLLSGM